MPSTPPPPHNSSDGKRKAANEGDAATDELPRQQQRARQDVYELGSLAAPHRELGAAQLQPVQNLWSLIESNAPLAIIQEACRRYPDQVQRPSRGRGGGGTLLHRACERGSSPDVLLYLLQVHPHAARVPNLKQSLPIHCYFGYCLFSGVQPSLSLVQSLMRCHPASCLVKPALLDRECPLNESMYFSVDTVQCMVEAFVSLRRQEEHHGDAPIIQHLIVPQETCQGEDLKMTKALAVALAPLLPFCKQLTNQTKSWTLSGFLRLMRALETSMVLQALKFNAFPSDLIDEHVSAQTSLTRVLQGCHRLHHIKLASRFPSDHVLEGEKTSDLALFCQSMQSVLPHLSSQTTLVLDHYGMKTADEACRFLTTLAPAKVVLGDLTMDSKEDVTMKCGEDDSVTRAEQDGANSKVEHLDFKACTLSPSTLTRIMAQVALFPRLRWLKLDMMDPEADVTDAVVILLENDSPLRRLVVSKGVVNHARLLQALRSSNNSSLHHYENGGVLSSTESQDRACYRQIKYLACLNHFGLAQVRDDDSMRRAQFVALLQGVSDSPLSPLGTQAIHFGLLREAPHLWSSAS